MSMPRSTTREHFLRGRDGREVGARYFSLATRSLIMRPRASDSLFPMNCTAKYPAPARPNPMARFVRLRLKKFRVPSNMAAAAAVGGKCYAGGRAAGRCAIRKSDAGCCCGLGWRGWRR